VPSHLEESRRWITGTNWYVTLGEYGRILDPYFDVFPRKQIRVVFSHDLLTRREEVLREVFAFLDVESAWIPPNLDVRYRQAATERRVPGLDLYRLRQSAADTRLLRRVWGFLPPHHRARADRLYSLATLRLDMWNAKRGESAIDVRPRTRSALEHHFREDGRLLASVIGRQPPWLSAWNARSGKGNGGTGSDG
jgi:hypothetical protein